MRAAALLLQLSTAAAGDVLEAQAVAALRRLLVGPLPRPCADVRKVGGKKKYPKAVCFDHFPPRQGRCTAIAVGARKPSHMGFDFHMARRHGCRVYSFDPFVDFAPTRRFEMGTGITFFKVGLSGETREEGGHAFATLPGLFAMSDGTEEAAVLKVDWRDPAALRLLSRVGQIAMEMHFEDPAGPRSFNLTRLRRTLMLLDRLNFCPFFREGHPCALKWAPCSPPNALFAKHFRREPTVHHPEQPLVRSWWELAWVRLPPHQPCPFRHWD
eukprot:TRINITY_DN36576_c0_g1_i2.p2 TRINITY_DN36576_c0_g1~~TRINITY_DN36576_c0_g1_i2.p2  ORF type:complete len:291 (+),score=85.50 TRINITY_DN36576_c0_g1_i2:64-873(+)